MKGPVPWLLLTLTLITASPDRRPQFTLEPPARLLWPSTRGATALCRATGHPAPDIHWVTAEGQILTSIPGLRHILSDGRLVLGARRSLLDAGGAILRCRASNRAGITLSRPVLMQPVEDSVLSHTVRQLTPAKVGGHVVLRCEVSMQVGMVEVTWLQDGLPLTTGNVVAESRWISGAGGLLLGYDLTQADIQAEYACVAADATSQGLRLSTDDSSWLEHYELNSIEAQAGDTVVLPCIIRHVSGRHLVWQRQDVGGAWTPATDGVIRGGALVLPNVMTSQTSRYSCSTGADTSPRIVIRLVVYEPLTVTVAPESLLLGTGGTGHFNCSVKGGRGGGTTISWQHEGRPLHSSHPRLTVGPVRAHHAGLYQCTAHDHSDGSVGGAQLVIADRPPRLVSTFSEAVARVGQTIALRCVATGVPPPRILWTLDERPLPSAPEKYSVTTRAESLPGEDTAAAIMSTLSVSVRTSEEGGRYGCNATNYRGSHGHAARINVFGPPNIRYLPAIHVKADTDVVLYCPYSGYPVKEVVWKREDGSPVDMTLEPGDDRGVLRLSSVRSSVGGGYACEVRAESGELARRQVRIEVHKPPKIVPLLFPEELEVGGSTQASCTLVAGDKPIQFVWLKDNLPIPPSLKVEQKHMDFFSLLIIHDLTSAHNGDYTCRATNDFGSVSQTAVLIVKEPPAWVWRAQNVSVSAGAAVLLPCSAKGQPVPRITWDFSTDGENWRHLLWSQTDTTDSSGGSVLLDGTVWLKTSTPDHEGWYRCTARAQHSYIHHVFFLDVREPPKLTRLGGGGETRWVIRGTTARLGCVARGEPEIHLHWTHDSRPLALHGAGGVESRAEGGARVSELTLTAAAPDHAGEYRCHARNAYGTDELAFRLFVKERPSTPEEVRVSEVWSRKARVTWRVARGTVVSHYTLQYRALTRDTLPAAPLDSWGATDVLNLTLPNSELLHVATEGLSRAGAMISGLAPDTRYALRLSASNDVGASPHTSPLHFTTREEAPGGTPRDITIRALKPRELHVTWQPPLKDTWHGTLLGFTIKWWEVTEEGKPVNEVPPAETGASAEASATTLRGLKPAARYGVSVRAYNAAGSGPASTPHYRHTLESPPIAGPDTLKCTSSSPTSLHLTWLPPALDQRGGVITYYTLQYTKRDMDPLVAPQDAHLRVQTEEATLSRLSPYSEYEIRVRAHNAAGDGPLSAVHVCRTDEDVPSAPGGMKLVALTERSLRASWLPPPEPNGKLIHYTLYVKDLSGSQEPNVTRVTTCTEGEELVECMRTLRGLRSGRTYEAWVRAATAAGDGPPSPAVACQTNGLAPARISSFGGTVTGTAGGSLSLRCVVGGSPPPARRWLRGGAALHPRPPFHHDGDALIIKSLELSHADNYTCVAENPHGTDSVTWRVIVLKPPVPPILTLVEARARELEFDLREAARVPGHALPKAYTLHWRLAAPEGSWRVQAARAGAVRVAGVRCGAALRVFAAAAAAAAAAGGEPAPELAVRTPGGPPIAPADARWIRANGTHARLDTSAWSDGGCGPLSLRLEWGGEGGAGGAARDLPPGGDLVLAGLTPGSRYRIAVLATNEAGTTREVYEFTTTPPEGGLAEEVDAPFPATAGELALLLALCAMLSLAALTILAILLRRKRSEGAPRVTTSPEKPGCGTYRAPPHSTSKLPPEPPDVYEISPYATFAGPPIGAGGAGGAGGSRAYTLQLRALARHDDDAAPPALPACCDEETCIDSCDAQRRRRRRRHYCPDHGNKYGCSQDSGS